MSHWNHRILKKKINGEDIFSIREVYYNDDGEIYGITEHPVEIWGNTIEEIKETCEMILRCVDTPVLIDGKIKFAKINLYSDKEGEDE